jgi:hypothetical protein
MAIGDQQHCSEQCGKLARQQRRSCQGCLKELGPGAVLEHGKWYCSAACQERAQQSLCRLSEGLSRPATECLDLDELDCSVAGSRLSVRALL